MTVFALALEPPPIGEPDEEVEEWGIERIWADGYTETEPCKSRRSAEMGTQADNRVHTKHPASTPKATTVSRIVAYYPWTAR